MSAWEEDQRPEFANNRRLAGRFGEAPITLTWNRLVAGKQNLP